MKYTKKINLIVLAIIFTLSLSGCTNDKQAALEARFTTLQTYFDNIETSSQQLSAQNDDITITIHHMVVEPDQLILDYTLSGSNEETLRSIGCSFYTDNKSTPSTTLAVLASITEKEGNNISIRDIAVCQCETNIFSKEDIGTNISLHFSSYNGEVSYLYITCKIADIYEPETISIQQVISYDGGSVTLLSVTQHACYSEITANMDTALDSFIFPQIYDCDGNVLNMLSGSGTNPSSFWYMPFPDDSDSIDIEISQMQADSSYKKLSDKINISFPDTI